MNLAEHYNGQRVLVTGHTGFKGSWLTEWLLLLGARVTGYSLPPPTEPALFTQLGLRQRISHFEGDVRETDRLRRLMGKVSPDFVFHLAGQSLVRPSYKESKETYEVNVMGTVSVLESLRAATHPCAAIFVTSDKCYEPKGTLVRHREEDSLGGHDPYSASKAAAEIAIASYRRSFFSHPNSTVSIASARAGNVLGGGDWAPDRIVPDCIRALSARESIPVRNPTAVRPWQHVLDPLDGYLEVGAALAHRFKNGSKARDAADEGLASAFNFGPPAGSEHSVQELTEQALTHWPGRWHHQIDGAAPHESPHLGLCVEKAARLLGWSCEYDFPTTVKKTIQWYRESLTFASGDAAAFSRITQRQIEEYMARRAKSRPASPV